MIKCLLGHVLPDSGTIRVAGEQLVAGSWSYRERIGYMPQIGRYPEQMRIRQVFSMMRDIRNVNTSSDEELYQRFGLEALQEKRMGNLSGGTRQRSVRPWLFSFDQTWSCSMSLPQVWIRFHPSCLKTNSERSRSAGR